MKIRIGFVSNSSTSSFVLAGFDLGSDKDISYEHIYTSITGKTKEEITQEMKDSKHDWYGENVDNQSYRDEYIREEVWNDMEDYFDFLLAIHSGSESGVGDKVVIGKTLARSGSMGDEWVDMEINMAQLIEELDPLKQKLGNDSELKIFLGTELC